MSEEMKLLMALCDALGFAVEVIHDRAEQKVSLAGVKSINANIRSDRALSCDGTGLLDIDDDGMYTSYLAKPITSYKLTRLD